MSLNLGMNAVIALIENRPEQFKEMLRVPSSDVKDISSTYSRLLKAMDMYAATKLRGFLMMSLHIQVPSDIKDKGPDFEAAYIAGIRSVEDVCAGVISILETE